MFMHSPGGNPEFLSDAGPTSALTAKPSEDKSLFQNIHFVRDELGVLKAVTAVCAACRQERSLMILRVGITHVRVRCPMCQRSALVSAASTENDPDYPLEFSIEWEWRAL